MVVYLIFISPVYTHIYTLNAEEGIWKSGQVSGAVYHGGDELTQITYVIMILLLTFYLKTLILGCYHVFAVIVPTPCFPCQIHFTLKSFHT